MQFHAIMARYFLGKFPGNPPGFDKKFNDFLYLKQFHYFLKNRNYYQVPVTGRSVAAPQLIAVVVHGVVPFLR